MQLFCKNTITYDVPGNDECVRVWDTEDFTCQQILKGSNWGQVTALTWIDVEQPVSERDTSICVGTRRGSVCVCPMSKERKVRPYKVSGEIEALIRATTVVSLEQQRPILPLCFQ